MKKWNTVKDLIAEHREVFGNDFEYEATNLVTGQVVRSAHFHDPSSQLVAVKPVISSFSSPNKQKGERHAKQRR